MAKVKKVGHEGGGVEMEVRDGHIGIENFQNISHWSLSQINLVRIVHTLNTLMAIETCWRRRLTLRPM